MELLHNLLLTSQSLLLLVAADHAAGSGRTPQRLSAGSSCTQRKTWGGTLRCLDVIYGTSVTEVLSPCNSNCDVLDMVEIQGSSLSCVLQWLRRESLVVTVYKAAVNGQDLCQNNRIVESYLNCVNMSVYSEASPYAWSNYCINKFHHRD